MKSEYLWDTNIIIYFLQHHFSIIAEKIIDEIIESHQPVISVITEIEMLSWHCYINDITTINTFLSGSQIQQLTDEVKAQTIEIRKHNRLKLPDSIIAATALVYNKTLITRNIPDFDKISQIKTA